MLKTITKNIMDHLPENLHLTEEEIASLKGNTDFFLAIAEGLIKSFYDTLYSNEFARSIFKEGERPVREASFKDWVVKTLSGNFDNDYWYWQAYVGILHIKRQVPNHLMIFMMGMVNDYVLREARKRIKPEELDTFSSAWIKLTMIVLALIAESYHYFYLQAITNVTGIKTQLLDNMVKTDVDKLLKENAKYRL